MLVSIVSLPLLIQGFWVVENDAKVSKNLFLYSLVFSLIIGEMSLVLYFWPVTVVVGSLFLTEIVYMLLGLGQANLENRLFATTAREYLTVGILVFFGTFLATHWGG